MARVHSNAASADHQPTYTWYLPRGKVYTPQLVIDEQRFAVSSQRHSVSHLVRLAQKDGHRRLSVSISQPSPAAYQVSVSDLHDGPASVWLVRLH